MGWENPHLAHNQNKNLQLPFCNFQNSKRNPCQIFTWTEFRPQLSDKCTRSSGHKTQLKAWSLHRTQRRGSPIQMYSKPSPVPPVFWFVGSTLTTASETCLSPVCIPSGLRTAPSLCQSAWRQTCPAWTWATRSPRAVSAQCPWLPSAAASWSAPVDIAVSCRFLTPSPRSHPVSCCFLMPSQVTSCQLPLFNTQP